MLLVGLPAENIPMTVLLEVHVVDSMQGYARNRLDLFVYELDSSTFEVDSDHYNCRDDAHNAEFGLLRCPRGRSASI
jgi:hypothetical protein